MTTAEAMRVLRELELWSMPRSEREWDVISKHGARARRLCQLNGKRGKKLALAIETLSQSEEEG